MTPGERFMTDIIYVGIFNPDSFPKDTFLKCFPICNAECPEWDKVENTGGINGQEQAGVFGSAACKKKCLDNPQCAGFDLDTNANRNSCWLHLSPNNFANPQTGRTGINLYKLIKRCPPGKLITALKYNLVRLYYHQVYNVCHYLLWKEINCLLFLLGVTPTPAPQATKDYKDCKFTQYVNESANGASKTNANSLDACLEDCRSNSACTCVEFSNANGCWMHTTNNWKTSKGRNDGVTIYEKTVCGGEYTNNKQYLLLLK